MKVSSIWYFFFWSLVSLVFLTTGVYALNKTTLIPDWFKLQFEVWIALSVTCSTSYAFLFRPALEHDQELDAVNKFLDFYRDLSSTISPLLVVFFAYFTLSEHKRDTPGREGWDFVPLIFCLPVAMRFICLSLKYYKITGNPFTGIAGPLLIYPYHTLGWIWFQGLLFFSFRVNLGDKTTIIFIHGDKSPTILALNSYATFVLLSVSILSCTIYIKSLLSDSSIVSFAYQQRKKIEIILGMFFIVLAQYFSREKSVSLMLAFISLTIGWLGNLANIQPCTDFGVFHFFVTSSLECAVSLFGLHFYTFVVLCGGIALEVLRWKIESVSLKHVRRQESVVMELVI